MRLHSSTGTVLVGLLAVAVTGACSGQATSPSPAPATEAPSPTPTQSSTPTVPASPSASPSSEPTDDGGSSGSLAWTEAATFDAGDGRLLVSDVSAWSGGFVAVGHAWTEGYIGGAGEPRIWTSADGREWGESTVDFGPEMVELAGILRLSNGGVVVVGDARGATEGPRARAYRSEDGATWTELDLPTEIAERGEVRVASGPVGHLITMPDEIWYSADAESWQLAHEAPAGVTFQEPAAGDEGFVTWASSTDGGDPVIYASGDGTSWFEGTTTVAIFRVAPWRGDWFGWGFIEDPPTMALFRSANGLEWSAAGDLSDLVGPDGPSYGPGMDGEVTEMFLSGDGGVLLATLGWNHCCAEPPRGVATAVTTDGETWLPTGLPEDAYVSAVATDGSVVVAVGHLERGARIGFWVANR
jgi:hypothetical protein